MRYSTLWSFSFILALSLTSSLTSAQKSPTQDSVYQNQTVDSMILEKRYAQRSYAVYPQQELRIWTKDSMFLGGFVSIDQNVLTLSSGDSNIVLLKNDITKIRVVNYAYARSLGNSIVFLGSLIVFSGAVGTGFVLVDADQPGRIAIPILISGFLVELVGRHFIKTGIHIRGPRFNMKSKWRFADQL